MPSQKWEDALLHNRCAWATFLIAYGACFGIGLWISSLAFSTYSKFEVSAWAVLAVAWVSLLVSGALVFGLWKLHVFGSPPPDESQPKTPVKAAAPTMHRPFETAFEDVIKF